jgi:hypothetical protein
MAIDRKLLEYALKGLEAERDRIDAELAALRGRLGARDTGGRTATKAVRRRTSSVRTRRKLSTAQRQAISERMTKTWAARRRQRGG